MNQKFLDLCRKCNFCTINGFRFYPRLVYHADHPDDVKYLIMNDFADDTELKITEDELKGIVKNPGFDTWIVAIETAEMHITFYKEIIMG